MDQSVAELRDELAKHHYSLTQARQAVFATLREFGPISPASVITKLSGHIDRASVYRNIRLFEELGIVHRLQTGWKYRLELSDRYLPHHHHLYCKVCGSYSELPADSLLEDRIEALANLSSFIPEEHQIEIKGICASCHLKRPGKPKPL